jgi:hypothetical protein
VVVGVIGFDQVHKDHKGFLVMLLLEVENGFQGEVSVLTSTFGDDSVLVLCAMLC